MSMLQEMCAQCTGSPSHSSGSRYGVGCSHSNMLAHGVHCVSLCADEAVDAGQADGSVRRQDHGGPHTCVMLY